MNDRIFQLISNQLSSIKQQNGCRILFACESGSRAWGFESEDSDYDIRFIYAYPEQEYLKISPIADSINQFTEDNLDLSGWELKKSLQLFAKCNLNMNEWFNSPTIYSDPCGFRNQMQSFIPDFFNSRVAIHHYISISKKMLAMHLDDNRINIKKLFYVLRPALAAEWVSQFGTMPPTAFRSLIEKIHLPNEIKRTLDHLIQEKKKLLESNQINIDPIFLTWILKMVEKSTEQLKNTSDFHKPSLDKLDEFAIKSIQNVCVQSS